jgi:hypothetical protein
MLTGGRAPVEGDSVERVWQRKLSEDPTPIRDHRAEITGDLEALVMSCLARDPADRPASMTALKTALVAALERVRSMESGLLPVRAPSETAVVSRWSWTHAALGAGGLVLALVGGIIWRASGRPPASPPLIAATVEERTRPAPLPTPPPPPAPSIQVPPPVRPAEPARAAARPVPRPAPPRPPAPVARTAPADDKVARQLAAAERLFQNGKLYQAVLEARAAVRMGAGAPAYLLMGKAHLAQEEPEDAVEAYTQALKLEPENSVARAGLARARQALDQAR